MDKECKYAMYESGKPGKRCYLINSILQQGRQGGLTDQGEYGGPNWGRGDWNDYMKRCRAMQRRVGCAYSEELKSLIKNLTAAKNQAGHLQ
jgi:hypothetical protein